MNELRAAYRVARWLWVRDLIIGSAIGAAFLWVALHPFFER